jgi:peptide/nickel transport system ATP-binding protein
MRELKRTSGAAIILITHDLGVVAEVCDEVAVMYAGEIVERAPADVLFEAPEHPYTVGLMASIPRLDRRVERLAAIDGVLPDMTAPPVGCRFADRCPFVLEECRAAPPPVVQLGDGHWSRCFRTPLERLVHDPEKWEPVFG